MPLTESLNRLPPTRAHSVRRTHRCCATCVNPHPIVQCAVMPSRRLQHINQPQDSVWSPRPVQLCCACGCKVHRVLLPINLPGRGIARSAAPLTSDKRNNDGQLGMSVAPSASVCVLLRVCACRCRCPQVCTKRPVPFADMYITSSLPDSSDAQYLLPQLYMTRGIPRDLADLQVQTNEPIRVPCDDAALQAFVDAADQTPELTGETFPVLLRAIEVSCALHCKRRADSALLNTRRIHCFTLTRCEPHPQITTHSTYKPRPFVFA